MRDMPVLAGPRWAELHGREKAIYNARARAEKRGGAGAGVHVPPKQGLMDSAGELLSVSVAVFPAAHVAIVAYSDLLYLLR